MNVTESKLFSDLAYATQPAPFALKGGRYMVTVVATFAGADSVSLEVLGADKATYLPVAAYGGGNASGQAVAAANGVMLVDIAPGQYQVVFTSGISAAYVAVCSIPV